MQAFRAVVVLVPDDGHVGRLDRELFVGEQHAGQRTHHLGGRAREIAHRMRCLLAIAVIAEVTVEHVHEARDLDLIVDQLGGFGEHAGFRFRPLRGEEAAGIIAERDDKISGPGRRSQPVTVAGGGIEIEKGLSHCQRIAEERAAAILVAMAEAAVGPCTVGDHPFRGTFCGLQCLGIAARIVISSKAGDRPAVFAGVEVLVDAGHAELAALAV